MGRVLGVDEAVRLMCSEKDGERKSEGLGIQ
jgi:hypothetical protein